MDVCHAECYNADVCGASHLTKPGIVATETSCETTCDTTPATAELEHLLTNCSSTLSHPVCIDVDRTRCCAEDTRCYYGETSWSVGLDTLQLAVLPSIPHGSTTAGTSAMSIFELCGPPLTHWILADAHIEYEQWASFGGTGWRGRADLWTVADVVAYTEWRRESIDDAYRYPTEHAPLNGRRDHRCSWVENDDVVGVESSHPRLSGWVVCTCVDMQSHSTVCARSTRCDTCMASDAPAKDKSLWCTQRCTSPPNHATCVAAWRCATPDATCARPPLYIPSGVQQRVTIHGTDRLRDNGSIGSTAVTTRWSVQLPVATTPLPPTTPPPLQPYPPTQLMPEPPPPSPPPRSSQITRAVGLHPSSGDQTAESTFVTTLHDVGYAMHSFPTGAIIGIAFAILSVVTVVIVVYRWHTASRRAAAEQAQAQWSWSRARMGSTTHAYQRSTSRPVGFAPIAEGLPNLCMMRL